MAKDSPTYGGQAVIEGVMMKGRNHIATAVRRSAGDIIVESREITPWSKRFPILKYPILRGALALVEAMVVGIKALSFSASQFAEEEDVELSTKDMVLMILFAFSISILFFVVLPAYAIRYVEAHIQYNVFLNLVEGLIKVSIFLGYVAAIGLMPDIRRVFQYHGAEHKTIHAYEAGEELTVENVQKYSTLHPRCGTNFIFIVLLVSVFVFSFFGRPPFLERVLIHIAILPLVAGISYEVLKQAGKKEPLWIFRVLALPGLWLQKLSTRPPSDDQVEVAIRSLQEVLALENQEPQEETEVAESV
ncbi:MAG: DUF1385 domain-containing protein [Firmicutes bacterium]|nr:DUF1385 domain-containing protein [Bacillota bacterium]